MIRSALALALGCFSTPILAVDLDWMAGDWCNTDTAGQTREIWTSGSGGLLLGMHKEHSADAGTAFEFLRIQIDGRQTTYFAQPGGRPATAFELAEAGGSSVVFSNPKHDFPKRIGYRRSGETLEAWIDDGSDAGQAMRWTWTRCAKNE